MNNTSNTVLIGNPTTFDRKPHHSHQSLREPSPWWTTLSESIIFSIQYSVFSRPMTLCDAPFGRSLLATSSATSCSSYRRRGGRRAGVTTLSLRRVASRSNADCAGEKGKTHMCDREPRTGRARVCVQHGHCEAVPVAKHALQRCEMVPCSVHSKHHMKRRKKGAAS